MRALPAVSAEYLGDTAVGNTGSPAAGFADAAAGFGAVAGLAAGAAADGAAGAAADGVAGAAADGAAVLVAGPAGAVAGVAAVRARHSLRKSAYFLSPAVLFAFMAFHSSLHVFKRF